MEISAPLAWLLDEAGASPGGDHFLHELGRRLLADGLPIAGGTLTIASAHPIVARRTWLWRADQDTVIEALGFGDSPLDDPGRDWLSELGPIQRHEVGASSQRAVLSWAGTRPIEAAEADGLSEAARFASAPIAALAARATMSALLVAYLGPRSAAQVEGGALRRGSGELIHAALLYADLRGFTAMSEVVEPLTLTAVLDAWFDRVVGAAQAFGGEVLKFIGDGVLVIFPVTGTSNKEACEAALQALAAAQAGMAHLDSVRAAQGLPPLRFGAALHLGPMMWGNIGAVSRLDFTAIGAAVNLVSRLEGLCRSLGRSVLISGAFAAETAEPLVALGEHRLRGIAAPCQVFTLPDP